jgi:hypothetical protein
LAHLLHERLTPSQGERPGRPTNPDWVTRCKVPMSAATLTQLARMAEELSTPRRRTSPMQVAAQLLEEALHRLPERQPSNGTRGAGGAQKKAGVE